MKFMKKRVRETDPKQLKRKLLATFAMLLVATIMMTTTSYAWLVLSVAPEVTGISTNVGANGALEIALLNNETRSDLNAIRTTVGASLATRNPSANNTWGNLIDLNYAQYGLSNVLLLPSRLRLTPSGDGYAVAANMLSVPTYGYDGRIIELNDETMSATYDGGEFSLVLGSTDYGVRAIGTTNILSVQGSALAMAKSNIKAYTNSAKSSANATLTGNGDALFNIMMTHAMSSSATFADTDLNALKNMLSSLDTVLGYIDLSLRQGVVAIAAANIPGKEDFTQVNQQIMDTSKPLSQLLTQLEGIGTVPDTFNTWISELEDAQNDLKLAKINADSLTEGIYTWEQFRGILDYIMNLDGVLINGTYYNNMDSSTISGMMGGNVTVTLADGSGILADIAKFTGNYNAIMTYVGTNITIETLVTNSAYLPALSEAIKDLEAADSTGESQESVALTSTYGYALDLAFRCNAVGADLLLQTSPENRIYDGNSTGPTMGGGSYMEFSTKDSDFTVAKMLELMDAIRVAFVDNQNRILGVSKLNTSNYTLNDGSVKAPLYLYDFGLSDEDGSILMGERRLGDNTITTLEQNVPKAVTAVVWLDGDVVDNTMVSATDSASLYGMLNLQFATNANLVPANNSDLMYLSADKSDLEELLESHKEKFEAGQGTYTTVSWSAFAAAYKYASAVMENVNSNDNQVYMAAFNLTKAAGELQNVSVDALASVAAEHRAEMGTYETGDLRNPVRYVVKNEDNSYAVKGESGYTQEEFDSWNIVQTIYQVDNDTNLHDEGNDIFTEIYTDESWDALANALYNAEATALKPDATDDEVNAALTALETAHSSLQRKVFFKPYDYKGQIFYEAICNAGDTDTYGKWYDSDFKRIVADIVILNLDAYATPVNIAKIEQNEFVAWNNEVITPYINILDELYPELNGEEIVAANWEMFDETMFREQMSQHHITTLNALLDVVRIEDLDVDTTQAEELLRSEDPIAASTARRVIKDLDMEVRNARNIRDNAAAAPFMTNSQRILLTTAISTAETVDGYADETKTELAALRTAVVNAQALLAQEVVPTKEVAEAALTAINAELKKLNGKEITAANTLLIFPGSISNVHAYPVEYPDAVLGLTGKTGKTQLKALVMTENGVIFTVTKDVTVYTPADGAEIVNSEVSDNTLELTMGQTKDVTAKLWYNGSAHSGKEETLGNVTIDGENITVAFPEAAKKWTWASNDTDVVGVSGGTNGVCTLVPRNPGRTTVAVEIETEAGEIYTARITVVVK